MDPEEETIGLMKRLQVFGFPHCSKYFLLKIGVLGVCDPSTTTTLVADFNLGVCERAKHIYFEPRSHRNLRYMQIHDECSFSDWIKDKTMEPKMEQTADLTTARHPVNGN